MLAIAFRYLTKKRLRSSLRRPNFLLSRAPNKKENIYDTHRHTSKSIEQLLLIWLLLHILMPKSHSTIKIGFYQDAVATQQPLLNETQASLQPERKDEILERCSGKRSAIVELTSAVDYWNSFGMVVGSLSYINRQVQDSSNTFLFNKQSRTILKVYFLVKA